MLPKENIEPATLVATVPFTPTVQISWDAVPNAISYNVYGSTTKDGEQTLLVNQTETDYIVTDVKLKQTYFYRVTAINKNDNKEIPVLIRATIINENRQNKPTTKLTVVTVNCRQIDLTWTEVNRATSYTITRSTNENGTFTFVATTQNTNYRDSNLEGNTTYFYRVTPYFNSTPGEPSNTASATTLTCPIACPCRCRFCCNPCWCNNCNRCYRRSCCRNNQNTWFL